MNVFAIPCSMAAVSAEVSSFDNGMPPEQQPPTKTPMQQYQKRPERPRSNRTLGCQPGGRCLYACMHACMYVNIHIYIYTHDCMHILDCMHTSHREPKCYQESIRRDNTCFRNYVSPRLTDCVKHTQMLGHLHEITGTRHHSVWIGVDFQRTGRVVI